MDEGGQDISAVFDIKIFTIIIFFRFEPKLI